jgi:ATP phosphoribosyltransferase
MLRIAVPNKGSLADAACDVLREAGYRQRRDGRELLLHDPDNDVEFFYLRPRDIAVYVGEGTLDVGITGLDLLFDSGANAEQVMTLGFGQSTLRWAAAAGVVTEDDDLTGKRIATSYAGIVNGWLRDRGIEAIVIRLDGAVESAVRLGVADVIADVVSTGTTLRQAGLEIVGKPILESQAVVVRRTGAAEPSGFPVFERRLQGVLVARTFVMMDYDIPVARVEEAVTLTPGIESPTVSPLHREGWVAVRSMVPRDQAQPVMDQLWDIGARGILVTDIHACRV